MKLFHEKISLKVSNPQKSQLPEISSQFSFKTYCNTRNRNTVLITFVSCFRENAPSQQECNQAANMINNAINKLDQASLAAISNNLAPTPQSGLKVYIFVVVNLWTLNRGFIYFCNGPHCISYYMFD